MTVFTAATYDTKTRLRPYVSRMLLQHFAAWKARPKLVTASAALPRQTPTHGFPNRAGWSQLKNVKTKVVKEV